MAVPESSVLIFLKKIADYGLDKKKISSDMIIDDEDLQSFNKKEMAIYENTKDFVRWFSILNNLVNNKCEDGFWDKLRNADHNEMKKMVLPHYYPPFLSTFIQDIGWL